MVKIMGSKDYFPISSGATGAMYRENQMKKLFFPA
jgi:hypothetical protein